MANENDTYKKYEACNAKPGVPFTGSIPVEGAARRCLDGWLIFEGGTLSDARLRSECGRRTHSLCLGELASTGTLCAESVACALHCLLSGGCLPGSVLSAVRSQVQRWQKEGVVPVYGEGSPEPSSLLELYGTLKTVLPAMRHPQAKDL